MKDTLILQDKIYISAKRVHEIFGYTSDYVGQLCRAGKLEARMVGRSWFVTEKSVADHKINALKVINPRIASVDTFGTSRENSKKGFAMAVASIVCGVMLLSGIYVSLPSQNLLTASLGSVSQNITSSLQNLFFKSSTEFVSLEAQAPRDGFDLWNGMVVMPSTGSLSADSAVEKKIRDSFSDEVIISMDDDRQSGIVTPVFKNKTGEDFLYVLVPVEDDP